MTTKHQVLAAMDANPKLNSIELGALLGCHHAYVRATARRAGRSFAERRPRDQYKAEVMMLGVAARDAGMTLDYIRGWSQERRSA